MKNSILKLGQSLSKKEQKQVQGGAPGDDFHAKVMAEWQSYLKTGICPTGPCFSGVGTLCINHCMVDHHGVVK